VNSRQPLVACGDTALTGGFDPCHEGIYQVIIDTGHRQALRRNAFFMLAEN
jgi:hypothetical protein